MGTMHRSPTLLFCVLFGFQIIIIYSTKFCKILLFEGKSYLQDASCKSLEKRRKAGIAALPKGARNDEVLR